MDLKRILTTLIGIPLVIAVIAFGNKLLLAICISIASVMCMYEYFKVISNISKPIKWVGYLSNIIIIFASIINDYNTIKTVVYAIPFIIMLLFLQVIFTNMKYTFKDSAYTLFGIMYIPFFLMFLELIRCLDNGKILVGYAISITWATDIFAYLIGRYFGKHKLNPISPKKTIEGAIAGVIGAVVFTLFYTYLIKSFCKIEYSYMFITIISIILSIVSQIGDFVASSIKRFVDIKDYGTILPGHGGMLDRIDSLIFLAPFAYLIFSELI